MNESAPKLESTQNDKIENSTTDSHVDLEKPHGVQKITTDDYGYVVSIIWKDGEATENHFPLSGFTVVDLKTKEHIRKISGEEACDILKENSAKYNRKDFSWAPFARKSPK